MITEEAASRITDKDNFADLPPVEVMNNVKKPDSAEEKKRAQAEEQEKLR